MIFGRFRSWLDLPAAVSAMRTELAGFRTMVMIYMTDMSDKMQAEIAEIRAAHDAEKQGYAARMKDAVDAAVAAQAAKDEAGFSEAKAALDALHAEMTAPGFTPSGNVPAGA